MQHTQLRAFHHVALTGGFSRAADMLNLTQPAISDQVRKLESSYDVLLFRREGRQVVLTEAGEALFQLTKPLFESEQHIREFLTEAHAAPRGTLRIIADSAHHITDALNRFSSQHPHVFVSICSGNTNEVLTALRNYDAEIGVVGALDPGQEFEVVDLGTSAIVPFVARDHELAGRKIRFADLVKYPLIYREKGSKTRQKLEDAAYHHGVRLKPVMEVEGREAMREVVATGAGVGFVSEAEFGRDQRLKRADLTDVNLSMAETLIVLKQRRDLRLIKAFWDAAGGQAP